MSKKIVKPRWFWYWARPYEIFVDLDSGRAITRALSVLRRALQVKRYAATPVNRLHIESVWMYPSLEKNHAHLIIVLKKDLPFTTALAWSLWMGTDQIRAAYVLERRKRCSIGELLCVREPYQFRKPDAVCSCKRKHKEKPVTDRCPALLRLLRDERSADYFPRNRDKTPRPPVRFAWGKVPLQNIRQWRSNVER